MGKPMQTQLALDSTNCSDREKNPTNPPVVTPTNDPVPDPTNAPVVSPTNAPVVDPTNAPTTVAPVRNPTNAPVPAPTPDENGNGCCSSDFKTCATWGNESREVCEGLGSMIWLENGP